MPFRIIPYSYIGQPSRAIAVMSAITPKTQDETYCVQLLADFEVTAAVLQGLRAHHRMLQETSREGSAISPSLYPNSDTYYGVVSCWEGRGPQEARTSLIDGQGRLTDAGIVLLKVIDEVNINSDVTSQWLATEPRLALRVDQILGCTALRWPALSVLVDTVTQPLEERARHKLYGAIRPSVEKELTKLGLAYSASEADLPYLEHMRPTFGKGRGRPIKVMIPTGWGIRLIELLKRNHIDIHEGARIMARRKQKPRPKPTVDEIVGRKTTQELVALYYQTKKEPEVVEEYRTPDEEVATKPEPVEEPNYETQEKTQAEIDREHYVNNDEAIQALFKLTEQTKGMTLMAPLGPPDDDEEELEEEPFVVDHRHLPDSESKSV